MRPLAKLYNHASELLAKARRDRDALRAAARDGDESRLRDEVFDFSVTAYHVRDWVKSLHPHLESQVNSLFSSSRALQACRDIANSNKHFQLDLNSYGYRKRPPSVKELDYSATPVVSPELALDRHLKVVLVAGQRVRVEDMADEAISTLEGFFKDHGLAP